MTSEGVLALAANSTCISETVITMHIQWQVEREAALNRKLMEIV